MNKKVINNTITNFDPFYSKIESKFHNQKNFRYYIAFNLSQLYDINIFKQKIYDNLIMNNHYGVLVKIRDLEGNFLMLGSQIGFYLSDDQSIIDLSSDIDSRFNIFLYEYNYDMSDILYFHFVFIRLDKILLSQFIKNDSSLSDPKNKQLIPFFQRKNDIFLNDKPNIIKPVNSNYSMSKGSNIEDHVKIPISVDPKYLGNSLKVIYGPNNNITNIILIFNNKEINFWEKILDKSQYIKTNIKNYIKEFNQYNNLEFYYINDPKPHVLVINHINKNTAHKFKFNINGTLVSQVIDKNIKNLVYRTSGNKVYCFKYVQEKFMLINTVQEIKFNPLKHQMNHLLIQNPNIGVIDCETYLDDGVFKIYSLGFKTNLNKQSVMYYIDEKELDSNKLVLKFINELLQNKYKQTIFYCHNLGGYDVVFLIGVLTRYNENNTDKYDIDCILRKDNIIKLTITKIINGNKFKVRFVDSYVMLNQSLDKLVDVFKTQNTKGKFPYKFSTKSNLFYKGVTPEIEYYSNITKEEYDKLYSYNWDFKQETLIYLEKDLDSLFEIMNIFNKRVFLDFNVNITDSNTISGLALSIFMKKYYKDNIPSIQKYSIYNDIKQGYYGGITEVYKPYGENLYYYDVNSLYPYVSLQDMPGLLCKKLTYENNSTYINEKSELFGFFYCDIVTPTDLYIGVLPYRTSEGLKFGLGKWKGWYFSEELKYACSLGYQIRIIKGYSFNKEKDVFKNYVENIYKTKCDSKDPIQRSMSKSLLNNLLGRFGINLSKPVTKMVSYVTLKTLMLMYDIVSYKEIGGDYVLVTYIAKMDSNIIEGNNLDIVKLLSKHKDNELQSLNHSSIVISAAVTSYARIYISKLKYDILSKGGSVFYSDTDSIVTDIKLENNLVSSNEIGKLKLESIIVKGIFISGKLYCYINEKGDIIKKIKGGKASSIDYTDYENLLNQKSVSVNKTQSIKDWKLGHVVIEDKDLVLKANSFKSRDKIYNSLGKWVDTKPSIIN